MELAGKKALFLGDSITEGVGTSAPEHIYLNVLKNTYHLKECVNYGISGSRISRQQGVAPQDLRDHNEDFCKRVDRMDPKADLVVVFGGTNDFGHGNAPFGCFDDRTPDTFYGACHDLMQKLLTKYPQARIVFLTPLHRSYEKGEICLPEKPYQTPTLREYRNAILTVADYYAIPVLDLYALSGIQPSVPAIKERFLPDGLHPSDAGNERIASLLGHFLEQL